jgi:ATP-dependent Zn protease
MNEPLKDKWNDKDEAPMKGLLSQKPGVNWKMVAAIGLFWLVLFFFFTPFQQKSISLPYSKFKKNVKNGDVASVTVKGDIISGKYKKPIKGKPKKTLFGSKDTPEYNSFKTVIP